MKASDCPTCGADLNAATAMSDPESSPSPGDLSLCIKCGELLVFDQDIKLALMSERVKQKIQKKDPALWSMLKEQSEQFKRCGPLERALRKASLQLGESKVTRAEKEEKREQAWTDEELDAMFGEED